MIERDRALLQVLNGFCGSLSLFRRPSRVLSIVRFIAGVGILFDFGYVSLFEVKTHSSDRKCHHDEVLGFGFIVAGQ